MSREWQPGDVALVEAGCWANRKVALRLAEGWAHVNGVSLDVDGVVTPIRPLVVIDPEDREQVERLMDHINDVEVKSHPGLSSIDCGSGSCWISATQIALREFADPKPPKPDEPTGKWAVVLADGVCWVRAAWNNDRPWNRIGMSVWADWSDLDVTEIKSAGESE